MGKARLEAFSDGVLAIIITIMVLELDVPDGDTLEALRSQGGVFLSYALSFVFIGIYWNNHHHLLHTAHRVSAGVLWANLHLLFWLSIVPWVTAWMGHTGFAPQPTALYGGVLLLAAIAFTILSRAIMAADGADSLLHRVMARDRKVPLSLTMYVVAVAVAWWAPRLAGLLYVVVAVMWLVPDRRIAAALAAHR